MEVSNIENKCKFTPSVLCKPVIWLGRKIIYIILFIPSKILKIIEYIFKNPEKSMPMSIFPLLDELKQSYCNETIGECVNSTTINSNDDTPYSSDDEIKPHEITEEFHTVEIKKNIEIPKGNVEVIKKNPYNLMDKILEWGN